MENIFNIFLWNVVGAGYLFGYFSTERAFKCFNEARIAAGWWYIVLSFVLAIISHVCFMLSR